VKLREVWEPREFIGVSAEPEENALFAEADPTRIKGQEGEKRRVN